MNFSNDGLVIALSYLLPGFIINIIISSKLLIPTGKNATEIYKFIFYSLINMVITKVVDKLWFFDIRFTDEFTMLILRNVITPIILGFLISYVFEKIHSNKVNSQENSTFLDFIEKIIGHMKLDRTSLTSSAWDHLFYNLSLDESGWEQIIVTLKENDEKIYGIFSESSFSSSITSNNNIFIEEIFIDDTFETSLGKSVFIDASAIKKIEIPYRGVPLIDFLNEKGGV
ncbi:DUF6338 family protein [uncultured Vagococcus sp.]|uniref:DUF6338 family protein n=1 Tax=uncultured Vagococcus sp. TaxID=189676 RepID=UPI00258E29E3|nr:DUF6338 family protein [uncultured Vagococcus sp.]